MDGDNVPTGGAFLVKGNVQAGAKPEAIFTPERLSPDARMMARAVEDFVRKEVVPVNKRLELHEPGLMESLLRRSGELGLLGTGVPERYGGLDLPKSQIALLMENAAIHPSFAISVGVHSGVATLPLLFFGTVEQRDKYLPRLALGEWIGAFALSEANSGSDALNAQAKAVFSSDGAHYVLNGTKMWITNGGFADFFTVFASIEGEGFSAFLVERGFPGVSASREEHKLGLRSSSTTRLVLQNTEVPVANVLGEVGKGHRPALYALNLGRLVIAATALGMCKENLRVATRYARERTQFGKSIAEFGLIREKLAAMAIRTFVLESMLYRTAGYLDALFAAIAPDAPTAQEEYRAAAEEYAVECALLKVFGTETLDFVVDETLQIHGGYGFSEEFTIAQAYRDARVFRIFEGTNEINRITIVDQLLRRDRSGRLALSASQNHAAVHDKVRSERGRAFTGSEAGVEGDHEVIQANARTALASARSRFGDRVLEQQEVTALIADMITATYAAESAGRRCIQAGANALMLAASRAHSYEAASSSHSSLRTVLAATGDETNLAHLGILPSPCNTIALRQQVAAAVIDRNGYPW